MKRTIEKGLPTWAPSYSPSAFTTISANYVPSANDVLNWGTNVHQAFIESSMNTYDSVNKIWTYTMTISESNISASNNNYGPVSSTCVVKVKVNANGTRSYVTGYDKYKGKMSAGATLVRIQ